MVSKNSERRLAENEVVFRNHNLKLFDSLNELNKIAKEEGVQPISLDDDLPLYFFCECADENCQRRIRITPKTYEKYHKTANSFIIFKGHDDPDIEDIVSTFKDYAVVQKHVSPPLIAKKLHRTDLHNT